MSARCRCILSAVAVSVVVFAGGCRIERGATPSSRTSAQSKDYKIRTLSSGKTIKVISFGPVESKPSKVMLDYVTDLSIYDSAPLEKEVEEIWADIRNEVPRDADRVEIMPREPSERRQNAPIQALSKAYVYDRCGERWCKGSGFERRD